MRNAANAIAPSALTSGWVIQSAHGYYTGDPRSPLESWIAFPQLAKVYKRKRWAHTMAARLGGQAVPLATPGTGRANPR